MNYLSGKKILLGVTGSIAAYKACELVRLLVKHGAEVQVVMTDAATHFIGEATFEALTRKKVLKDLWEKSAGAIAHIDLVDWADLIVIAPATANFIAKLSNGICDDLLTSTVAARKSDLMIAPAMNTFMWNNPANLRNVRYLSEWPGITFLGPEAGIQACGDQGKGRLREPADLCEDILKHFYPKLLGGKTVLITAGPTFEPVDPVRGLTNRSSGKQGFAIAEMAARAGASVLLVAGPVNLPTPAGVERFDIETAEQMKDKVFELICLRHPEVFIAVAAVADYRPVHEVSSKIKRENTVFKSIELTENEDILKMVGALPDKPLTVGFAAETENIEENAKSKLVRKNADMIIGNSASAINSDVNTAIFVTSHGSQHLPCQTKQDLSQQIIIKVAELLKKESQ